MPSIPDARPARSDTPRAPAEPGFVADWWRRLRPGTRQVNLALQGGGAHGAFTWGVLDALLAEPRIGFEGLSGSSAGAMNAVVFAHGWLAGGRDGARQALADFWTGLGKQMPPGLVTRGEGDAISLSPASRLLAEWAAFFSPAQLNPLGLNPLRDLIAQQVDFERLRAACPFKLFIGTTQVTSGKLRIFRETELKLEMLLASACLPKIHRAVEIDGQAYWDGGYAANPAVFPLFYDCDTPDIVLVPLSPLQRIGTPRSVEEIELRILELGFSTHFMREMRMFAQATEFAAGGILGRGRLERRLLRTRFHMIDSSALTSLQRTETQGLAHLPFLHLLRDQGRARAEAWLAEHFAAVGKRSSVDIRQWFA